jgi:hypothetical protein
LTQCSAAKYVDGVMLIGEHQFSQFPALVETVEQEERRLARKSSWEKQCGQDMLLSRRFA